VRRPSNRYIVIIRGRLPRGRPPLLPAGPRASVVRATADIPAMTQITADMVELSRSRQVDVSTDAAQSIESGCRPVRCDADPCGQESTSGPSIRRRVNSSSALARARPGRRRVRDPHFRSIAGGRGASRRATRSPSSPCLTRSRTGSGFSGSDVNRPRDEPDDPGPSHAKRADLQPNSAGLPAIAAVPPKLGSVVVAIPAGSLIGLRNGCLELGRSTSALSVHRRHCLDVLICLLGHHLTLHQGRRLRGNFQSPVFESTESNSACSAS